MTHSKTKMVKWCTGEYEVSLLRDKAMLMKSAGEITKYRIRKTIYEGGKQYGVLWIQDTHEKSKEANNE